MRSGLVKPGWLEPENGSGNRSHLTRPLSSERSSARSSRTGTRSGSSASSSSRGRQDAPFSSPDVLLQRGSHIPQPSFPMVVVELVEIVVSGFQKEGRGHFHRIVHITLW